MTTYLDGLQIEMHPDAVLFHTRSGKAYGREHMRSVGSAVIPRSYFWRTLRAKTQRSYLEGWRAGGLWGVCAEPSLFLQLRGRRNVPTRKMPASTMAPTPSETRFKTDRLRLSGNPPWVGGHRWMGLFIR